MMKRIVQSTYVKYQFSGESPILLFTFPFFLLLDVSLHGEPLHTGIKSGISRARYADPYKYYYKRMYSTCTAS